MKDLRLYHENVRKTLRCRPPPHAQCTAPCSGQPMYVQHALHWRIRDSYSEREMYLVIVIPQKQGFTVFTETKLCEAATCRA